MSWFDPATDTDNAAPDSSTPPLFVNAARSIVGKPMNILKATILQGQRRLRGTQPLADATGSSSSDGGSNGISSAQARSELSKGTPQESGVEGLSTDLPPVTGTGGSRYDAEGPLPSLPPSTVQMPTLAEQGPRNPVLKLFSRLTGMTKASPAPGQPYSGPIGPEQKRAALGRFLGRVGEGLEMAGAGGTPEERTARMELPLEREKIESQRELARAQLESLNDWREAQAGVKQQQADTAQQKVDAQMRSKFYVPDEAHLGQYRNMTLDELASDPNYEIASAAKAYKQQQAALAQARTEALTNPNSLTQRNKVNELAVREKIARDNLAAMMQRFVAGQEQRGDARTDRSYQFHTQQINARVKPIQDRATRLANLTDSLNAGNPQADALIAPELLTVMAGGMGSGLRMNEAEISRIVGGRNNWESIKSAARKWQLDPNQPFLITPAQRQQIYALLQTVNNRVQRKLAVANAAQQEIISAQSPEEHRQIYGAFEAALNAIDSETEQPTGPTPIHALPSVQNKARNASNVVEYERGADGKLHPKGR